MSGAIGFGLALAGFAALALGQEKHHSAAFAAGRRGLLARLAQLPHAPIGWTLVAAAAVWYCFDYQIGYGLTVLAAALTVAGWIVATLLNTRPRWVPWLPTIGLALAGVALISSPVHAATGVAWHLPPGPHAVGFRAFDLVDATRTHRAPFTATGERERRDRSRPIQTSVWYPAARGGGLGMPVVELLELGARQGGPVSAAESKAFVADAVAHHAPQPGGARTRIMQALAQRTAAARGAPAASGRHPVVIYNAGGGQPSWDNFVLCQYLASHGFVVVASPNTDVWSLTGTSNAEWVSAEASARDLEFLIGWVRTLPYVDAGRLALMGYSWGGQAAVMVALRNAAVQAVVSLDGSEGNPEPQWLLAPHSNPRHVRAAYMGLHSSPERSVQVGVLRGAAAPTEEELAKERASLSKPRFAAGLKYADAYTVVMERFHHGNFASHWAQMAVYDDRRPSEPTREQEQLDSAALARYVLHFLRAYVRGEAVARRWLARSPAENGIPPRTLRVEFRPASRWPRPAFDEFARVARARGLNGLKALVAQARAEDSTYGLAEDGFIDWYLSLSEGRQAARAIEVLRWGAEAWPDSVGIRQYLCPALKADRAAQLVCYRRQAELSPDDAELRRVIVELEAK